MEVISPLAEEEPPPDELTCLLCGHRLAIWALVDMTTEDLAHFLKVHGRWRAIVLMAKSADPKEEVDTIIRIRLKSMSNSMLRLNSPSCYRRREYLTGHEGCVKRMMREQ